MKERTASELTDKQLIDKALGRSNLSRTEQRRLGLLLKDKLAQCALQAEVIRKLKEASNGNS